MFNISVCDDSPIFLQITTEFIHKWSRERNIPVMISTFENGDELLSHHREEPADIIFLDIIMPMFNGMEATKILRKTDRDAKIIFLTSSPEFALESYEVKAENYLLKPISYDRLQSVLDDCLTEFQNEPEHLILNTSYGYQKLYFHEIEYAEAQNKRVTFHLITGQTVESVAPFYFFEKQLSGHPAFFKCHRSYLVYLPNVDHFNTTELLTKSGHCIPIARSYSKTFKEAYFALMFQETF